MSLWNQAFLMTAPATLCWVIVADIGGWLMSIVAFFVGWVVFASFGLLVVGLIKCLPGRK